MATYTVIELTRKDYSRVSCPEDYLNFENSGRILGSGYTDKEVQELIKGYSWNGMALEKLDNELMYIVEED
jgi:hypothetical protein